MPMVPTAPIQQAARDHAYAAARALGKAARASHHHEFCKGIAEAINELADAVQCQFVEPSDPHIELNIQPVLNQLRQVR